jgi:hypothetical protein
LECWNAGKIIDRLKQALEVKSYGQLSKDLGIFRQNIDAARKRGCPCGVDLWGGGVNGFFHGLAWF